MNPNRPYYFSKFYDFLAIHERSGVSFETFMDQLLEHARWRYPKAGKPTDAFVKIRETTPEAVELMELAKKHKTLERFVCSAQGIIFSGKRLDGFEWPDQEGPARFESGVNVPSRLLRKAAGRLPSIGFQLLSLDSKRFPKPLMACKFSSTAYGVFNWRTGTSYASRWHSKRESGKDLPPVGDHTGGYGTVCATVQDDAGTTIATPTVPDSQP